jgi:hypothetical protein
MFRPIMRKLKYKNPKTQIPRFRRDDRSLKMRGQSSFLIRSSVVKGAPIMSVISASGGRYEALQVPYENGETQKLLFSPRNHQSFHYCGFVITPNSPFGVKIPDNGGMVQPEHSFMRHPCMGGISSFVKLPAGFIRAFCCGVYRCCDAATFVIPPGGRSSLSRLDIPAITTLLYRVDFTVWI